MVTTTILGYFVAHSLAAAIIGLIIPITTVVVGLVHSGEMSSPLLGRTPLFLLGAVLLGITVILNIVLLAVYFKGVPSTQDLVQSVFGSQSAQILYGQNGNQSYGLNQGAQQPKPTGAWKTYSYVAQSPYDASFSFGYPDYLTERPNSGVSSVELFDSSTGAGVIEIAEYGDPADVVQQAVVNFQKFNSGNIKSVVTTNDLISADGAIGREIVDTTNIGTFARIYFDTGKKSIDGNEMFIQFLTSRAAGDTSLLDSIAKTVNLK